MKRNLMWLVLFVVFAIIFASMSLVRLATDWLWFSNLSYQGVFFTILAAKIKLGAVSGVSFFLLMAANLFLADRLSRTGYLKTGENTIELPGLDALGPHVKMIALGAAAVLALAVGSEATAHWSEFLLFLKASPFGKPDPVFGLDIGFYVFRLPFLNYLYKWGQAMLVLCFLVSVFVYAVKRGFVLTPTGLNYRQAAMGHVSALLAVALALKALGYRLLAYNMLYTARGFVAGAGFTDVHVRMSLLWALSAACLLAAAALVANVFIKNWKIPGAALALLALVMAAGAGYPEIVQRLRVTPNEISAERPYIQRQIEFTRAAYDLEKVQVKQFPAEQSLSASDIRENDLTVKNIRLWDARPLLQTYQQLQEIRTYYSFAGVDIDRYEIGGEVRQVMLSARELSYNKLPSRTWVNERLSFTHGYGVCMTPVNRFTEEGMPVFFIRDIPPVHETEIKVERPQIYYGELSNDYVFTRTDADEFDYPKGEQNVLSAYTGSGGVPVSSLFKKLLFALRFSSLDILLNTDINRDSRIMFYRNLRGTGTTQGRASRIMPLVAFEDPYIAVSEGKLKWIMDGYTYSRYYPYSEPSRVKGLPDFNYIRNSVKTVVDAYDGTVDFYAFTDSDPIIQSYSRIFPGLFHDISEMPADLRSHIRYPIALFGIQSAVYSVYQMTDPLVFYNKEDMWTIPNEVFDQNQIPVEPYYTVMKLPEEKTEEFILMMPFTPMNKDNLSAWMCARNDGGRYGELIVYKFPKKKLIFGPSQVEARIDQDPEISRQLSLWSQKGSQIIRGNLLVIPIEDSLLYVEPLFLKAEKGEIPELKRVIVSTGNRVVMEPTLELALESLLGESVAAETSPAAGEETAPGIAPLDRSTAELIRKSLDHMRVAKERMKSLDWKGFGDEFRLLEDALIELQSQEETATGTPVISGE